jgi:hypothetical protein
MPANDLVNWASWEPNKREAYESEPGGSYAQQTNHTKFTPPKT